MIWDEECLERSAGLVSKAWSTAAARLVVSMRHEGEADQCKPSRLTELTIFDLILQLVTG